MVGICTGQLKFHGGLPAALNVLECDASATLDMFGQSCVGDMLRMRAGAYIAMRLIWHHL